MMMDEFIFGLSMIREYVENVSIGNYTNANEILKSIWKMN